jgi:hypothetical protein
MIGLGGWLCRRPSILTGFACIILKQQKTAFAELIIPITFNHPVVVFYLIPFPALHTGLFTFNPFGIGYLKPTTFVHLKLPNQLYSLTDQKT